MDIHDAVELIYSEMIKININDALTGKYNLNEPRNVIGLLIESNIITKDTINHLHKKFVISQRDERQKIIEEWLLQDSILYQKIFRSNTK